MRTPVFFAVLLGCATPKPTPVVTPAPPPPAPVARPNAVRARVTAFDVSACAVPVASAPVTNETLSALLSYELPRFAECLAAEAARERPDATAELEVEVTQKTSAKVTPRGVTPEGVACLERRAHELELTASSPAKATLVVSPPAHLVTAKLVPEAGGLRSAIAGACGCFTPIGQNAPPQLELRLTPEREPDVVTSSDPLATMVERCLETSLAAHPRPTLELTVDLPLLDSDATRESPDAIAEVAQAQRAVMATRSQRLVTLLDARRAALVNELEPIALRYKRKPTPSLSKQRLALCTTIHEVEDALLAVLERARPTNAAGHDGATATISTEPVQLCASVKRPAAE